LLALFGLVMVKLESPVLYQKFAFLKAEVIPLFKKKEKKNMTKN